MLRRLLLPLLLLGLSAGVAAAATVDPGLQAELQAKAGGFVDVMMLIDQPYDYESLDRSLAGATPEERRAEVIRVLKAHAAVTQAEARRVLDDAVRAGHAEQVRVLWLANALAFRGDAEAVASLAASKSTGTLVHDATYDMLSGVMAPGHKPSDGGGPTGAQANASRPGTAGMPALAAVPTDTAWGVRWVKATRVWIETGYMGTGVIVGHFDTGAWLTHPDLVSRLWVNSGEVAGNGIDDDGNGYIDDVNGYDFGNHDSDPNDDTAGSASNHGTHTSGTVLGDGTNGTVTGVAPRASLMVCKVFTSDGSGASFSSIYEGQQYAIEMGARIFTMSLGLAGTGLESLMRIERQNAEAIRTAGVAFFNSAGNDHGTYTPPNELGVTARVPAPWNPIASTPYSSRGGVMAVGGTSYNSNANYFYSARGPVGWSTAAPYTDWPYPPGLIKPDMVAPGVNVNSLQKPSSYTGNTWSGTSMSCPHAAGVAALMLEKNPSLSPAGIDSIIEQTALDLGTVGKDVIYGSGQLNALAAVNAVPAALRPHLTPTGITVTDANADGVLDPGESFNVVYELTNNSLTVNATNVTGGLAVAANPHVSVTDAAGTFPDMPLGGGTGTNAGNIFTCQVAGGAPQGYVFTLLLTVMADTGYQVTFDTKLAVGLPDFRQHNIGGVQGTVTDQGIIGYMSDAQAVGTGFGYINQTGVMFLGSFWGGTDQSYVCNRDYSGVGAGTVVETYEWITTNSPNGRVQVLSPGVADQEFQAIFNDGGHAAPRGVHVTQHSYAWADAGYEDFIMLEYTIKNNGASTINGYYAGVFVDWDIANSAANYGNSDATRHMTYVYENVGGGVHSAIALLYPHNHHNLTMINNPTYVYPEAMITDSNKGRFLRGLNSFPTGLTPDDWSALTSCGPFSLAPGTEQKVVFALVMGSSLADLESNVDAAQQYYYTTPVADNPIPVRFGLDQNHPNPFNPATTINFTVERTGAVGITIFDLAGRRVKELARQEFNVGRHNVTWDGTNDAGQSVPAGMYLYRYESNGQSVTRKMVLVK